MSDLTELCARLRDAQGSLSRAGVTVTEWNGSLYLEAAALIESLQRQLAERDAELERERMRLAACGVAADQNTELSRKLHRLDADSEYRSGSYYAVCAAVDREMANRANAEAAEAKAAANADDAELGRILMRYIDRLTDYDARDTVDKIIGELSAAVNAEIMAARGRAALAKDG